jgi:glycosyltransferase involved in cell wall biosynthesis
MKSSLIIPCFNESKNLPHLIERCKELAGFDVEVILVDNGSTDDSPEVLQHFLQGIDWMKSVRVERNQGYGHGILCGLRAAKGEIIGWTHADMQTDPKDFLKGLAIFAENPQVFVKGRRHGRPLFDRIFTAGMSLFEALIFRRGMWDINAQPTMFPRSFFSQWSDPPNDFSLDLYAYYSAKKTGLRVRRFPVFFGKRLHGVSHWNIDWKSKLKFIRRTVSYSFEMKKRSER